MEVAYIICPEWCMHLQIRTPKCIRLEKTDVEFGSRCAFTELAPRTDDLKVAGGPSIEEGTL